ncbi:MAG: DNA repair protein RecO [Candidatus Izemoplasmatales bacterium]|nr:DNA repair protein RecO [Candidatus Izemoplasmatales bacterium]MDD3864935.1 DNA repair protein RecO [Candidatus Izemoplasmatales bacterium]
MEAFEGLILKQINFKESSKILYIYTEKGQMSLLVHGAKKLSSPFLNLTQNLTLIKFYATGKALKTLTDGEILTDYRKIKTDLEKFTYVQHLMEIINYFSESEYDHQKLYTFLKKILSHIENETHYIRYVYMFELKYLYLLGVAPNFNVCSACGVTDNLQFAVKDGGYACKIHATANSGVSHASVAVMKQIYYHDLKTVLDLKPDPDIRREIRLFLDEYYLYHLNFTSKSRTILSGLLGY